MTERRKALQEIGNAPVVSSIPDGYLFVNISEMITGFSEEELSLVVDLNDPVFMPNKQEVGRLIPVARFIALYDYPEHRRVLEIAISCIRNKLGTTGKFVDRHGLTYGQAIDKGFMNPLLVPSTITAAAELMMAVDQMDPNLRTLDHIAIREEMANYIEMINRILERE